MKTSLPSRRWLTPVLVGVASAAGLLAPVAARAQKPAARPASARAAAAAPKAVKGPTVEGITEYTLPNGLRVLLFPDASKPTTTVNITYFVGSRNEAYGETGMAHLLEHLVFKGTPKHPNIPQELTERGSQPNGTTWFDRTNYYETFPANDANLEWALDLEADRMVNSFIAKKDLDSEMTVVRNEFEAGENSPFFVLLERTLSTAYLWHNYGKSTIGARSDLENVPIERLQGFYRKYYQPDNAMLVVAGKFEPATALRLIEQNFGRIPRPKRTGELRIWPTYTAEPTQDGERTVTLRRVGDLQVVNAAFHVPVGAHEDWAALDILTEVLGDEPSGRLYKALVEPKQAARVGAFGFQLREPGAILFFAEVRADAPLDTARATFERTIDEVIAQPATQEEVERARTALLKNIDLTLNNSEQVGLWLTEWAATGDWRLLFIHRDRLKKATPADVQRVAAAYLKPSNRTLGLFIPTPKPERAEMPASPDIAALVKDYRGDTAMVAGEAFDPSPSNIDSRTTKSSLPSGFELAFLPKKTRGGNVAAAITLRLGSEQALMNRGTAGEFAANMLMRGTAQRPRQQLKDELDRLKARVQIFGGATTATALVQTTRENLPAVLRIVAEVFREPAFDAKEFEQLKQEQLATLEEQKSDPMARGFTALNKQLNPWPKGHPRYVETVDEKIESATALTVDQVKAFWADFSGADAGTMAVVGDFDAREIEALARASFGDWKAKVPFVRIASPFHDVKPELVSIETPDKAMAIFLAGLNLPLRDTDPDYPALVLADYMLGGGFLNSRLATRLRQKEGLSYGVGSSLSGHPIDPTGRFMTYAIYAPENAGKLEAAFREEIDGALKEGFAAEEIRAAKEGYLQSQQLERADDARLVNTLDSHLYFNRSMAFEADIEKKIAALTPEQILAALREHIDPARFTIVKAGDFAKKAGGPVK